MGNEPTRVAIIVDLDFGEGLFELSRQSHVWIVDTPANRAMAERARASSADYTRTTGVTTFKVDINDPFEFHRLTLSSFEARRLPDE